MLASSCSIAVAGAPLQLPDIAVSMIDGVEREGWLEFGDLGVVLALDVHGSSTLSASLRQVTRRTATPPVQGREPSAAGLR